MTANLTELWEHFIANTEDAVDQDWQPRFVWISHAVVKITPKRIYTEPYRTAQLWGYQEVAPYFDRAALEQDGNAWHKTRPPGGNPCYLQLYISPDTDDPIGDY